MRLRHLFIEENPDLTVYIWNEKGRGQDVQSDANQITVPSSKGKYIYEVLAEWTNGTISSGSSMSKTRETFIWFPLFSLSTK